jgi:nucleoside-diphosphate-sugar epimerase
MKIFITGATGFIGSRLAMRLANEGNIIHALYRSEKKNELIKHPNILLFKGDILDKSSIDIAIRGCEQVYHTAAFAKAWDKNPSNIYRINIEGSINVINCGIRAGVNKFVCTSTAGVFGPSGKNNIVDESSLKPMDYFTDYESSKAIIEQVLHTLSKSGISIVITNPTRVYGPGLLSESNGVTRMIKSYIRGGWRMIPGNGNSAGNYVHVEDVVTGHILAMNKGVSGENYILGGDNVTYNDFFRELSILTGKKQNMIHIHQWFMIILSYGMLGFTKITGNEPLITPPLVHKFLREWNVSSNKAKNDLGYNPMCLAEGLTNTLKWLNSHL